MTTRGSVETASRTSYAYGCERSSSGDLQTDRTFTGQKRDATGLKYDNDRCYDPALGTFVSPDYMVPNAARVIDYEPFSLCKRESAKVHIPRRIFISRKTMLDTGVLGKGVLLEGALVPSAERLC